MCKPSSLPSRLWLTGAVTVLLALHAWLALSATINMGVTTDETAHLTGGYSYWHLNDYRLQPENGNLPQRWGALPLLVSEPRFAPTDAPLAWDRSHVWLMGQYFFFEAGNNTEFMVLLARSAMVGWSVATALLVFAWSRALWGERGGLLSLIFFVFSPTTLAHGPLVTSDMCATFCLLAATGAWWRLLEQTSPSRVLASLTVTCLAALAKFSFVLLVPTYLLLLLWRCAAAPSGGERTSSLNAGRWLNLWRGIGLGVLHVGFAWIAVWAAFGFRYEAFSPDAPPASTFFASWERVLPEEAAWSSAIQKARDAQLLPEAFLQGFSFVMAASQERGAFLAGNFGTTGWWWFFPYAFLVKSTLAELLATIAVLVVAVSRLRHGKLGQEFGNLSRMAPLLILGGVYAVASITSNLNIGHRHILPLYPILFILSGSLARHSLGSRGTWASLALTTCTILETFSVRPHYLAFFNRLAGGPVEGWHHLVDSSLDWGQNVPRLAKWVHENREPGERVYVSMFGSDDIFYHGIDAEELAPYFNFGRRREWDDLHAGMYCISATMLQDVYSPFAGEWTIEHEKTYQQLRLQVGREALESRSAVPSQRFDEGQLQLLWVLERARFARLCAYLRFKRPQVIIGHSIFVYRLSDIEVEIATRGSLDAYVNLIDAATSSNQGN